MGLLVESGEKGDGKVGDPEDGMESKAVSKTSTTTVMGDKKESTRGKPTTLKTGRKKAFRSSKKPKGNESERDKSGTKRSILDAVKKSTAAKKKKVSVSIKKEECG